MTLAPLPACTDVLIVGGGPVGLAMAVELGKRGVDAVQVERNSEVGRQPRAKTTNVRTMEHMRRWGLAEKVRDAAPFGRDYPSNVVFATRLFGHRLALFENVSSGVKEENPKFSEPMQWIAQYHIERVLRDEVLRLPSVKLVMDCEMSVFTQDDEGVTATLQREGEAPQQIRAKYLVGADGGRSGVRKALGFAMEGRSAFQTNIGAVFRAPGLSAAHPQGPANMYWVVNQDAPAMLGPMDKGDLWFTIMPTAPDETPTAEQVRQKLFQAIGREWDIEILTLDPWAAHSLVSNGHQKGRVILIGDACHLHPPFGGFGLNMGVADAVDAGWKLAATLLGWGGPNLLASYTPERQPVHVKVIEEAVANTQVLTKDLVRGNLDGDDAASAATRAALGAEILEKKQREFHTLGVVLGICYDNSPINANEAGPRPAWHFADYTQSAQPGALAPHLWLKPGLSLYDQFGQGFTLLVTGSGAQDDIAAITDAAAARGIPLSVLAPDDARLAPLYEARLAVIRPDQYVAWRGDRLDRPAGALLDLITGRT